MEIDTLVLAIVQREDADAAIGALNRAGFAVTLIASVGGFLRASNVTLLIGLRADDVERALGLLKAHCLRRVVNAPTETTVGGATIFVLPIARYVHWGADQIGADSPRAPSEPGTLQMILAIVAPEQSGKLVETLTDWSYRATLISTTGGFWRRGNATILSGVRAERADSIITQIRQVCEMNSPSARATIFVLDVAQLERL